VRLGSATLEQVSSKSRDIQPSNPMEFTSHLNSMLELENTLISPSFLFTQMRHIMSFRPL
jgi:hypothetical protein